MTAALRATCSCVFFAALTDRESAVFFRLIDSGKSTGHPLCHIAGKVDHLFGDGGEFRFRSGIAVPQHIAGNKLEIHSAACADESVFLFDEVAVHATFTVKVDGPPQPYRHPFVMSPPVYPVKVPPEPHTKSEHEK